MENSQLHRRESPGHVTSLAAGLLCIAAGVATLFAAGSWWSLCRDGTFDRCLNGRPSFELVFQVVLAASGFALMLVTRGLVNRRAYGPARAAFAVAVVLLAGWALFLDAATHGWDDLKLI